MKSLQVLWGAKAIGRAIGRSERETFYLLEKGRIEAARKVGEQWTASKAGLRRQFCADDAEQDDAA